MYVNGCYGNNWKVREFFFGYCVSVHVISILLVKWILLSC